MRRSRLSIIKCETRDFRPSFQTGSRHSSSKLLIWRPRRDLNPCYRRESGMTKRNSNKLQGRGRTGWRSRSSKEHLIVSPMCPRTFDALGHFPAPSEQVFVFS